VRTAVFTALALVAFAGNSLLCRMALGPAAIDAASFSTIRMVAGACCLGLLTAVTRRGNIWTQGSWLSAVILFVYAIPFSYAYGLLTAGTGALILFGTVQVTMIGGALVEGERPRARQWVGLLVAIAGLVYLLFPGIASPSPAGAALMAVAGVAWALYSIQGRGVGDPVAQNGGNFIRTLPMLLIVSVLAMRLRHVETSGAILAILSGAVTTGLGYAVWYSALRELTATRAALVQLLVPVITVTGGVLFLREPISPRVVLSAAIVIGGIALALSANERGGTRVESEPVS
jgi:drug/metabolite transporter (DMT)-like permease